jgi:hypothetical protein
MKIFGTSKRILVCLALPFLFAACLFNSKDSGKDSGSRVKTGLYGRLVDVHGVPVASAKVKATSSKLVLGKWDSAPLESDSTESDGGGFYHFDGLHAGTYNLLADYGNGESVVLIRDIDYDGDNRVREVATDTLRPPGRIQGRVLTHTDEGGVLCYIPGTSFVAISSDSGGFSLTDIPQGTYVFSFRKEGLKTIGGITLAVVSGKATVVPDRSMEADPAFPPPAPGGLTAAYDTLTGTVLLRWNSLPVSDLDGYLVFRNNLSSPDPLRLGGLVKDTFYVDTLYRGPLDEGSLNVAYRLKAQDLEANQSLVYSKPVEVSAPSPSKVRTFIGLTIAGGATVSIGDTIRVLATYGNATRANRTLSWFVDGMDNEVRSKEDSSLAGTDTLQFAASSPGQHVVHFSALDAGGSVWRGNISVSVVRDPPVSAILGGTTVKIGMAAGLSAQVSQAFGSIVMYKWDDGKSPGWDDSSSTLTHREYVYTSKGTYPVRLYVRDDDGNADSTTLNLAVTNDGPMVSGLKDTVISIDDTVAFSIQASDPDGVSSYRWDFDGDGQDDDTTETGHAVHAYSGSPGHFAFRVSVQDSFDGVTNATADIDMIQDPPLVNAGRDTTVSLGDTVLIKGVVSDRFGRIVSMARSVGGGAFQPTLSGDTVLIAPASEILDYRIVLRATDDDGNTVQDTVLVRVEKDLPVARIVAGDSAVTDSLFPVSASASTPGKFGRIVKYEWSFGSLVDFRAGPRDTLFNAPSLEHNAFPVVLRITDEDGGVALDTQFVVVHHQWSYLGSIGITSGSFPTLSARNGDVYLGYIDYGPGNNLEGRGTVTAFRGGQWATLGEKRFTEHWCDYFTTALGEDGTPYSVCEDTQPRVHRFSGSAWVAVDPVTPYSGKLNNPTIHVHGDVPYVVFSDDFAGGAIRLLKLESGSWKVVGPANVSSGMGWGSTIAFLDDVPYVAYEDATQGNKAVVVKLENGAWVPAGAALSQGAARSTLISRDGKLYAGYVDAALGNRASVKRFNGSDWVPVGPLGFTEPMSDSRLSLDAWNDTVYVGIHDGAMRFTEGAWKRLGRTLPKAATVTLDGSVPYLYFNDPQRGPSVMVYR